MDNSFRNNQLVIFQSLVDGTMRECAKLDEKERRHLSIGAFDTVLALRNFGRGIPVARLVRQLFPVDDPAVGPDYDCISDLYPIEDLLEQDVFELATFQKHEGTRFCFKSGKRERFNVEPDWVAPEGLLFRIEWKAPLPKDFVLTPEAAAEILRKTISQGKRETGLSWRPVVRFNGEQLNY